MEQEYGKDSTIQNWIQYYNENIGQVETEIIQGCTATEIIQKQQKQRRVTLQDKYSKIRETLLKSHSNDRLIRDTISLMDAPEPETCINYIKDSNRIMDSDKRHIIYLTAEQGKAIRVLKQYAKSQRKTVSTILKEKQISYSESYCRYLVSFNNLVEKNPKLMKCSVSIGLIINNIKTVEKICEEFKWNIQ